MQVIPRYAAALPINIPNVKTETTANIHAGAKMLRHKVDSAATASVQSHKPRGR
jgi:hypothetical protein